ncbi:MAG: sigma-70 family RNA polymerase sigma factor [Acidimicrobiia bacterium]|nr:sigma-70 family RNA polymerase sigma factor [Acidimicrobiia bacterium]
MNAATTLNTQESFAEFAQGNEPKLRRALVARYGADLGRELTAAALAYGWEHWKRVGAMDNPAGYLYRVGQSKSRRWLRRPALFPAPGAIGLPWVEPGLPVALEDLSPNQRQAVVLVHGYSYTHAEVADLLGLSRSSIQNHVERGLAKLRNHFEVTP